MSGWGMDPDKWMIRQSRQTGNWHVWPPQVHAFYQEHTWHSTSELARADFIRQTRRV